MPDPDATGPVRILVKLLGPGGLPMRQTRGSAGFDLAAAEDAVVKARAFLTVSTGIALGLPAGVEAQVRPRSGLAARHGIGVLNSPGTIDSDYRGEVKVVLYNCSDRDFRVRRGDRVAQLVFSRVLPVLLCPTTELADTERGAGGFGHTG